MVTLHNGLVACPKCAGSKTYTPVGLARHYANVHPVKIQGVGSSRQLANPCPIGSDLSCLGCYFSSETRCRFSDFKSQTG